MSQFSMGTVSDFVSVGRRVVADRAGELVVPKKGPEAIGVFGLTRGIAPGSLLQDLTPTKVDDTWRDVIGLASGPSIPVLGWLGTLLHVRVNLISG